MTAQTVLILGASSDIALAVAHRFADEGWNLQLTSREARGLRDTAQDLRIRYGVEVSIHLFDTADFGASDALIASLPSLPRIVVSAIGILPNHTEAEMSAAIARTTIETNLTGPSLVLVALAHRLAALEDKSTIIGISSIAGDRGRAVNYWYGAGKAGFTAVLSGLRQKYHASGLRVITVKPGFVRTKMTEGMNLPRFLVAEPQEIADLIYEAWRSGKEVVVPWKWRLIMGVIRWLPEAVFKRVKL